MIQRKARGTAVNRGRSEGPYRPDTAEVDHTGRMIVRYLEGTDGEALMTEIAAQFPEVSRHEVEHSVDKLRQAGIVEVDPGHGETQVHLGLPPDRFQKVWQPSGNSGRDK